MYLALLFQNFFSIACTITKKCTENAFVNFLVNLSGSKVWKGLLFVYASTFNDKAVCCHMHFFKVFFRRPVPLGMVMNRFNLFLPYLTVFNAFNHFQLFFHPFSTIFSSFHPFSTNIYCPPRNHAGVQTLN